MNKRPKHKDQRKPRITEGWWHVTFNLSCNMQETSHVCFCFCLGILAPNLDKGTMLCTKEGEKWRHPWGNSLPHNENHHSVWSIHWMLQFCPMSKKTDKCKTHRSMLTMHETPSFIQSVHESESWHINQQLMSGCWIKFVFASRIPHRQLFAYELFSFLFV